MPLPLPIMIPFMMWQSAAIAAGFGTYFQFAKRKVSAMSNDEFNKANPHDLVDALYDDIVKNIPSSFKQIESLTPIILDSMLKMLTDAAQWFSGVLGGQGGLADIQHHLQGLPGHIGHAGFGDELPGGETGGDTAEDVPDDTLFQSISLTQTEILAMTDTQLALAVEVQLSRYTPATKLLLKAAYARRELGDKPNIVPPSEEQQNITLPLGFLESLVDSDMAVGGHRHRNYKGTLLHWIVNWKFVRAGQINKIFHWENNKWTVNKQFESNIQRFWEVVNTKKVQVGAVFVLGVAGTLYLIQEP